MEKVRFIASKDDCVALLALAAFVHHDKMLHVADIGFAVQFYVELSPLDVLCVRSYMEYFHPGYDFQIEMPYDNPY